MRNVYLIAFIVGGFSFSVSAQEDSKIKSVTKLTSDTIKHVLKDNSNKYYKKASAGLKALTDTAQQKKLATSFLKEKAKTSGLQKLKEDAESLKKAEPQFNLGIENGLMYMENAPLKNKPGFLNVLSVSTELQAGKIPLVFDFSKSYNSDTGFDPMESNLFKLNFDRNRFDGLFRSDLEKYTEFKKQKLGGLDLPAFTKKTITSKLRKSGAEDILSNNKAFTDYINDPEKITSLLALNELELREKLNELLDIKNPLRDSKLPDAKLSDIKPAGAKLPDANLDDVKEQAQLISRKKLQQGADSVVKVIASIKKGLAENGLDEQSVGLFQKYLSGKGTAADMGTAISKQLGSKPEFSKGQAIFNRIRSVQTGSFSTDIPGSFKTQPLFVQGAEITVKTRQGPVQLGFGSYKDSGMPKDAGFEQSSFSYPRYLSFASLTTHSSSFGKGKISWAGVFNKQEKSGVYHTSSLSRSSMAFTVSQDVSMNKLGKITVDVSKSASQYRNTLSPVNDQVMLDKTAISNYFTDDLFETLSVGLSHDIDVKELGLSNNIYFNYAGTGFQNPGAAGIAGMKMRVGGNLKKKMLKNKLSLNLRTDFKNTPLNNITGGQWKNHQVQFDSKYNFSRKFNLGLKYMENGMNKVDAVRIPVYSSRKLQVSGNSTYKIGSYFSFSHLDLGQQEFRNVTSAPTTAATPVNTTLNSNLFTLNYNQSVVINGITLSGTLFCNKEAANYKLIGDMISSDLGCQFSLFKKLSLTSSLTYLDNKDQARQVGIKQNMQLAAGKHFDINAYADLRKNLIQPLYPDLYTAGRAELSVRYYLNNK